MNLTDKQELFVHELIKGKSQREAYKSAYDTSKMSDSVIDVKASELMKNGKVAVRYNELHSRVVKEAEDECIVSAKDVLREYAKIGFSDIKNFLSFRTEKVMVGIDEEDDEGRPIYEYRQVIEMKPSVEVDGTMIGEVSISPKGVFSFKLHNKMDALDKMGKHLGMFTEKAKVVYVDPKTLSDDELEELIKNGQ